MLSRFFVPLCNALGKRVGRQLHLRCYVKARLNYVVYLPCHLVKTNSHHQIITGFGKEYARPRDKMSVTP